MSELKSLLNEFDISLSDDDEMDRRDEPSRDRGEIDFDDYDGEGEEGEGEFNMSDDEKGEGEEDFGDEEGEFAGEKRVDITDKLKAMLQRRGEAGPDDGEMNGDEELPSLGDLDLDDDDELGMDDEDDLDFDYNAFKNGEDRPDSDDEDDDGEFNFSSFSR